MSDYYLVSKSLLDNGLKEVADAIRQSGGTTAKLSFPTGMAAAVKQIKNTTLPEQYLTNFTNLFRCAELPEEITVDLTSTAIFTGDGAKTTILNGMFRECTGCKKITLKLPDGAKVCTADMFYFSKTLEEINIIGDVHYGEPVGGVNHSIMTFAGCEKLKTINTNNNFFFSDSGKVSERIFSNTAGNYNSFWGCLKLVDVRFPQNHAATDWVFKWSPNLSDATLVSVANALTVGSYTLTLHATASARCAEITGTVSDGVFTADSGGTTTLTEFITTTKGWSLANG